MLSVVKFVLGRRSRVLWYCRTSVNAGTQSSPLLFVNPTVSDIISEQFWWCRRMNLSFIDFRKFGNWFNWILNCDALTWYHKVRAFYLQYVSKKATLLYFLVHTFARHRSYDVVTIQYHGIVLRHYLRFVRLVEMKSKPLTRSSHFCSRFHNYQKEPKPLTFNPVNTAINW